MLLYSDNIQDRVRQKGNQDGEMKQMNAAAGQLQDKQREGHGLTSLSDGEGGVVPDGGAGGREVTCGATAEELRAMERSTARNSAARARPGGTPRRAPPPRPRDTGPRAGRPRLRGRREARPRPPAHATGMAWSSSSS